MLDKGRGEWFIAGRVPKEFKQFEEKWTKSYEERQQPAKKTKSPKSKKQPRGKKGLTVGPKAITILSVDDWEALYVGNEQVASGHRIGRRELIRVMKEANSFDVSEYEVVGESAKKCFESGNLPEGLYLIPLGDLVANK